MGNYFTKRLLPPTRKNIIEEKLGLIKDLTQLVNKYDYLFKGEIETTMDNSGFTYNLNSIIWFKDNIRFVIFNNKVINIINTKTNKNISLIGHNHHIKSIKILSDNRIVSFGNFYIMIWDSNTGILEKKIFTDVNHQLETISEINNHLIGHFDFRIKIWNLKDYTHQDILKFTKYKINTLVTFNNKIAYSFHNVIEIWENSTIRLEGHSKNITVLCFLSDTKIVSGSNDKTIRLWNILSKKCEHIFYNHVDNIYSILSLDRDRFVSTDIKGTIIIWNSNKLENIFTFSNNEICFINIYLHKSGNIVCWYRGVNYLDFQKFYNYNSIINYTGFLALPIQNSLCILNSDTCIPEKILIYNKSISSVGINSEGKIAINIFDKIEIYS